MKFCIVDGLHLFLLISVLIEVFIPLTAVADDVDICSNATTCKECQNLNESLNGTDECYWCTSLSFYSIFIVLLLLSFYG